MKRVVCFYIPEPMAIKHAMSFILLYEMKIHFRFFVITWLSRKNVRKIQIYRIFLSILLQLTCQRRVITYDIIDELQHLSLSKRCQALCHKLVYEIVIFHSINGET